MMTLGKKYTQFAALAVSVVALSACSSIQKADRNYEAVSRETETNVEISRKPLPVHAADSVTANDGVWLGDRSFRAMRGDPLPSDTNSLVLVSVQPMDIYKIATEINNLTGIPVVIEGDAAFSGGGGGDQFGGGGNEQGEVDFGTLDGGDPFGEGGGAEQFTQIIGSASSLRGIAIDVNYEGTLEGLLNQVATAFGVEWVYEEGEIRLKSTITRTFTLTSFTGEMASSMTMAADVAASGSAGEDGGEAGGTANSENLFDYAVDAWGEIEANVVSLLPEGSAVGLSPSAGTITVTAPVWAMRRVEDYVDELNKRYSRQVTLNVDVLQVRVNEEDDYQMGSFLTGTGLFNGDFGLAVNQALTTGSFPGSVASGVLTLTNPNNRLSGSQAAIGALSSIGEVSIVQQASLTTINGRPAPLNATNQITYISGIEEEEDSETGDITRTIETDVFTTGFTMSIIPRILSDGQLMVQYGINIAEGSISLCTGGEEDGINCPEVNVSSVMQQVVLESNQTAVVAGFEQNGTDRIRQGSGTPDNFLLGGRQQGGVDRRMFVVLITPRVQDMSKTVAAIQ